MPSLAFSNVLSITNSTSSTSGTTSSGMWVYYVMIAVLFIAMYFFSIRPQKKQEKELKNLRDNLQVGDEIMTIGGIYGTVVRIKEDRVLIASGSEKTKIEFAKNAISTVLNRDVKADANNAEAKEEETEKISPKKIKKLSKKEESEE